MIVIEKRKLLYTMEAFETKRLKLHRYECSLRLRVQQFSRDLNLKHSLPAMMCTMNFQDCV